jgi:hypothetical protein
MQCAEHRDYTTTTKRKKEKKQAYYWQPYVISVYAAIEIMAAGKTKVQRSCSIIYK